MQRADQRRRGRELQTEAVEGGVVDLERELCGRFQYTASAATNTFDATVGTPVDTALPKVSGTALPGNTLSCSKGSWSNDPTRFSYQWERGGRPIAGAPSGPTLSRYG